MKNPRWSACPIAAVFGGLALAFSLAGCASASKPQVVTPAAALAENTTVAENAALAPAIDLKALNAAAAPSQPRIVTKDYANVQVTGSMLTTKMPTDPNAHPLPNANPVRTMSPEEFERIVDRGLAGRL